MPNVRANGVRIEYEEFGESGATPLLLIMGLGAQMVRWETGFCEKLAGLGFRVIRFDNRDVGLSTKFNEQCPDPAPLLLALLQGKSVTSPYTLEEMAEDASGLLKALSIPAAHVVGESMGGMIAQLLAILHPEQVLSLTSIMSTTGNPSLPQGDPHALALLARPVPSDREGAIQYGVDAARVLASPGFPFDEARVRELAALSYDRDSDPRGAARQLLAIMTAPGRNDALKSLKMPALVIHGSADPLVPIAAGFDTAEAIPGAEMMVIEGMGHELPEGAWSRAIDAIGKVARRATG